MAPEFRIVKYLPEAGKRHKSQAISAKTWDRYRPLILQCYIDGMPQKDILRRLSKDEYHPTPPQLSVKMRHWGLTRSRNPDMVSHAVYENMHLSLYTESGVLDMHCCELNRVNEFVQSTTFNVKFYTELGTELHIILRDLKQIVPEEARKHMQTAYTYMMAHLELAQLIFGCAHALLEARCDSILGYGFSDAPLYAESILIESMSAMSEPLLSAHQKELAGLCIDFEDRIQWYRLHSFKDFSDTAGRKAWLSMASSNGSIIRDSERMALDIEELIQLFNETLTDLTTGFKDAKSCSAAR